MGSKSPLANRNARMLSAASFPRKWSIRKICDSSNSSCSRWTLPEHRSFADWHDRDWGLITTQDYANMEHVQAGMKSRGFRGLRLNPRQESNVLHMHRVIDSYLTGAGAGDRDPR